jgi:hypothetical protein
MDAQELLRLAQERATLLLANQHNLELKKGQDPLVELLLANLLDDGGNLDAPKEEPVEEQDMFLFLDLANNSPQELSNALRNLLVSEQIKLPTSPKKVKVRSAWILNEVVDRLKAQRNQNKPTGKSE